MNELLNRYNQVQQKVIVEYWEAIRFTRKTGRISDGIKRREMEYWNRFEPNVVIQALQIHMEKYPTFREEYTRGIMRNLQRGLGHASTKINHAKKDRGSHKHDNRAEQAFRQRLGY